MRILYVHNFYRSEMPSGEDSVVNQDIALLRAAGHEVELYSAQSDDIADMSLLGRALVPARVVWSHGSYEGVREAVRSFQPDVAHVHNTFPLLSPAVLAGLSTERVPVVATLHNFRTACAGGFFVRDNQPCFDCIAGSTLPAMKHACYRGSRAATAPLAVSIEVHRRAGTWQRGVDLFITMSNHAREIFVAAGIPEEKLRLRLHSIDEPPRQREGVGERAVFAGRLSADKGALWLARAWDPDAIDLEIIGDGPEFGALKDYLATQEKSNVHLLGGRTRSEVRARMAEARLLVVASRQPETFGLTAAEAMSVGVPVVGPNIGATPEIVENGVTGLIFQASDPVSLREAVERASNPAFSKELGLNGRRNYEAKFSPVASLEALVRVYQEAIDGAGDSRR